MVVMEVELRTCRIPVKIFYPLHYILHYTLHYILLLALISHPRSIRKPVVRESLGTCHFMYNSDTCCKAVFARGLPARRMARRDESVPELVQHEGTTGRLRALPSTLVADEC